MTPEDNSLESGYDASSYNSSLESNPSSSPSPNMPKKAKRSGVSLFRFNKVATILTISALMLILLVGGLAFAYDKLHSSQKSSVNSEEASGNYKVGSSLSVANANESELLQVGQVNQLVVNGQLKVTKSLVLSPASSVPSNPVAGEIYYDKSSNQPYYFNGSKFVSLVPTAVPQQVTSLGGSAGAIGLGTGLTINGGNLSISSTVLQSLASSNANTPVVNSLQGLTGAVTFSAGPGIAISGTNFSNTGVINLTSSNSTIGIANQGNGTYDLTLAAGGAVYLGPNTAQTDASSNPSIYLNKTGTGDLIDLQSNGIDQFVVNQAGQITTGTIAYSQVQGRPATTVTDLSGTSGSITVGSGLGISGNTLSNTGVTNVGGDSGAIAVGTGLVETGNTLSNSGVVNISGTANQVIASAATGSLTLSLPQSIATGSSPTFNGETLTGGLTVSGSSNLNGGTSTDTLTVTGGSTLEGASTENSTLNVQGGLTVGIPGAQTGNIYLSNTSSTNKVDLVGLNPTGSGNATIQFPTITAGATDNVCLEALGNCGASSSTVTTSSSGTAGTIAEFTGADQIANSSITDNGTTVTIGELLTASTISASTLESSGTLNITPGGNLTVGANNHVLSLVGNASSTFAASANGFTDQLGFTAPTSASHNVTLPDATGTVCLENSLSCGFATSGSGVTSVDLLTGSIAISDTSGVGSTITIQNASTSQEGIAQFNASDFQASGGSIDTIQGITTASDVQFDSLGLDYGSACTAGGNLCLNSNASVYAANYTNDSSTNNLVVNGGNNNIMFENDSGANSFLLPSSGGTGQVICTSGITCASGGGQAVILGPSGVQDVATNLTSIYIDKTAGTGNLVDLQTGSSQNALVIDGSGNATFSNTTTAATLDVTGTLQAETITPNAALTVGSTSQSFTLQGNQSSEILGQGSGNSTYLGFATPTGNSASSGTIYYDLDNSAATNTSGSPYFVCTTAGNCSGTGGSVTALGGSSANVIPLFTTTSGSGGNLATSILSESGSNTINVAGNLSVGATGHGQLSVGVASTVNGTIVVNNSTNGNNITIQQAVAPSSNVTLSLPNTSGTFAVSATGPLVLNSTSGVLSCPTCDSSGGGGGSSAVQSLNTLVNNITLNNATTSGQNININQAKADGSTLGIAAFDSTNFTDNGSGVINTAQNITTSSSPTFANLTVQGSTGLTLGSTSNDAQISLLDGSSDGFKQIFNQATLTGNQAITVPNSSGTLAVSASGNLSLSALGNLTISNSPTFSTSVTTPLLQSSGALNITPGGALTVGATSQSFTLQGTSSSIITATNAGNTTTINFNTPTANNAIFVPNQGGTICLSSNNCGFAPSGNYILNQTTQQTNANIDIQSASGAVAAKIQGASGQDILDLFGNGSSSTRLAYFDSSGDLVTGPGTTIDGATISGGTLSGGSLSGGTYTATTADGLGISATNITATGALTINSGGTNNVVIDTGSTGGSINIGPSNAATINIGGASSSTVNLGTSAADNVSVGSGVTTGAISLGPADTSGNINIGGTSETGTLTVGQSTSTNTIAIGSGSSGATTVQIANSSPSDIVSIGSALTSGTINIGGASQTGATTLQGDGISDTITGGTSNPSDIVSTTINSSKAFEVQNTSGSNVLNVSTSGTAVNIDQLSAPGSISITLLTPPTSPSVTVHGTSGSTNYSYEVSAIMPSGFVTAVSAVATTSTGNATLSGGNYNIVSWTAVAGASSYNVYRTVAGGTSPTTTGLIDNTASTTINDNGLATTQSTPASSTLSSSATYYYKVTALDSLGDETTASSETSQATSAANEAIGLSWAAVPGAKSYHIYRGTSTGAENIDYTSYTNSFTDYGTATSTAATPPTTNNAYSTVITNSSNAQVTIGSGGTATGQLYIGGSTGGVMTVTAQGTTGGAIYKYEVIGLSTAGNILSQPFFAGTVGNGNATLTSSNYNALSWPAIAGAASYNVYRLVSYFGSPGSTGYIGNTTSLTFNDTGLTGSGSTPSNAIGSVSLSAAASQVITQGSYSYVLTSSSLQIFNVSNPQSPTLISSTSVDSTASAFAISGQYAYIGGSSNILQVFNISNPSGPTSVGSVATVVGTPTAIVVSGEYAYIGGSGTVQRLESLNISNPANPTFLESIVPAGLEIYSIAVQGNYLYDLDQNGLRVINISNPSSMVVMGYVGISGGAETVAVQGNYAYVISNTTFTVIDISNPNYPTTVGALSLNTYQGTLVVNTIVIQGRYAYITPSTLDPFYIVDISNPTQPYLVSTLPGLSNGSGNAEVSISVSGRYAYLVDANDALQIDDLGGEYAQQLQAGGIETGTLQVDNNASVSGNENIQGSLTTGQSIQDDSNLGVSGTAYIQGATSLAGGVLGGVIVNGLSTPTAPTITPEGTTGSTNYSYVVVAVSASGGMTPASTAGSTATGNTTLSGTNYNLITWTPVNGAVSYSIYRTVAGGTSPTTTGLIGSTTAATFSDTGLAGNSATPPSLDTSGQLTVNGPVTLKDDTNSATAFQVQNASGVSLLTVDTTTNNLVTVNANETITSGNGLTLTGSGTLPSSPTAGELYYDTAANQLLIYENGQWQGDYNSSTEIVAASNSADKYAANYVATGTNDQNTINSAISALPSTGGSVVLLDGTYNLGGDITMNKANVVLSGQGTSTVLYRVYNDGSSSGLINVSASNTQVQQLEINGNDGTYNSANDYGLYLNSNNAVAQNLTVVSTADAGIYVGNLVSNIKILSNNITNSGSDGIYVNHDTPINISNNYICSNTGNGINNGNAPNDTVNGNIICSNTSSGINGGTSWNITNNLIYSNGSNGINTGSGSTVTSNQIYGNTNAGIVVGATNNTISGNNISSNVYGIYENSGGQVGYDVISNNYFSSNSSYGIDIIHNQLDNQIIGNQFYGNGSSGDTISILTGSSYNEVINNQIIGTGGAGYAIYIGSGCYYNYLSGNVYSGTGASSIDDLGADTIYNGQQDSNGNIDFQGDAGIGLNTNSPTDSIQGAGSLVLNTLSTPAAPTVSAQGTTGSTTWGYEETAFDGQGQTLASTQTTISNGNATLSGSNYNLITPSRVAGAVSYNVYRTSAGGTPSTTGLIGNISGGASTFSLSDTGLTAGAAAPSANTTGQAQFLGYSDLFKNSTNSSTAFQVQNSSSVNLLQVDTSGNNIYLGGNNNTTIDVGAVGSAANTTAINIGTSTGAAQTLTIGSTNAGSTIALQAGGGITANTTITQTVASGASTGTISLLGQSATNSNTTAGSTTVNADSITLTGTNNSNVAANVLNGISFNNVTAATNNTFNGLYFGSGYTNGIQFASSTGVTNFIKAPNFQVAGSGAVTTGTPVTAVSNTQLIVGTDGASNTGEVIQGSASQTADLLDLQNSSGNNLSSINSNGQLRVDVSYASLGVPSISSTNTATTGGTLAQNTTYYYEITAVDAAGGETSPSSEASRLTGNTTATNTITLTWAPITGAAGYRIYRGTTSSSETGYYSTLGTVSGSNLTFTDTGSTQNNTITTPPTTNTAVTATNNSNNNLQVSIGGNGTPTGQLYVSGTVPSGAVGSVSTDADPYSIYASGSYVYAVGDYYSNFQIFDVSNPANPVSISNISTSSTGPGSVYVQGHYAYITETGSGGVLQIINIANPSSPVSVGSVSTGAGAGSVYVQGSYAYITNSSAGTMSIVNISNPANPVIISDISTSTVPGPVYVQGNYAYVVGGPGTSDILQIINISNPASPTSVGSVSVVNYASVVKVSGDYAYVVGSNSTDLLQIINISNPASPTIVGSVATAGNSSSVYVQGRYAYVVDSNGPKALQIFDISNPVKPYSIGSVSAGSGDAPFNVYVQGRYAYVASSNAGSPGLLQIFDLGGAYIQQLQTGGIETGTLQVDSNAQVTGDENIQGSLTTGQSIQDGANLGVTGGANIQGTAVLTGGSNQLSTPGAPTVTPTGATGSTSYSYTITALNAYGGQTVASSAGSTSTGNATLSGSNYNAISWTAVTGATSYDVYRTVASGTSPTTTGLIGSATSTSFNDTGLSGAGNTSPTINTTAQLTVEGSQLIQTTANTTTAFQVQNSAGTNLIQSDTLNGAVTISDGTTGTAGTIASAWSTTTSLGQALASATSVVYNGYIYELGGTNGSAQSTVYYAPINANGTIGSWNTTTALSQALDLATSVVYNGYIYELGGTNGSAQSTVYYAPINANGTIGTWNTTTALSQALEGATSVVNNGYIYELGGYNGGGSQSTVYYAPIKANGTIGTWNTTTALSQTLAVATSVVNNGYIYELGGCTNETSCSTVSSTVYYAPINANGTIGSWNTTTALSQTLEQATSVVSNGYIYELGGENGGACGGLISTVYYAPISANGTIGTWNTTTSISQAQDDATSVAYNGYVYELGGYNCAGSQYQSGVYYSTMHSTGSQNTLAVNGSGTYITGGIAANSTNTSQNALQLQSNNINIATISGTGATTFQNTTNSTTAFQVQNAAGSDQLQSDTLNGAVTISNGTTGTAGTIASSWSNTTALPQGLRYATSVTYNGYVYEIGGFNNSNSILSTVYYAPINANGTIGTWNTTTALSQTLEQATSVVYNGYVYVLGGYSSSSGGSIQSTVYYAPINANGTIGTWNTTTALSQTLDQATSVVYNGYIYELGGNNGSDVSTVYYAPINANGTIGSWNTTTALSQTLDGATSVVYNGYVYELGGNNGSSNQSTVYYAPINANGTIGTWNTTTALSQTLDQATSVVYNGYIYEIGGGGANYYAPINANGTIGSWASATSLNQSLSEATSVVYNGYVYVLGGFDGNDQSTVYYASLFNNNQSTLTVNATGTTVGDNVNSSTTFQVQNANGFNLVNVNAANSSTTIQSPTNNTTAFQVQNASGSSDLTVDTTNNLVGIGSINSITGLLSLYDSSNNNSVSLSVGTTSASYSLLLPTTAPSIASTGQCLNASSNPSGSNYQLTYSGCGVGGGHSANIVLNAEYIGAALDAASDSSCSSANVGTMTSGFASSATPTQNYYEWTTSQGSSQCYDVVVQVPLPSDFGSFPTTGTTFQIYGTNSSGTNTTAVEVDPIQCNGSADPQFGSGYVGISTGTSWGQTTVSGSSDYFSNGGGTANYTSCGYLTLKLRLTAASSSTVQIGNINIPYTTSATYN